MDDADRTQEREDKLRALQEAARKATVALPTADECVECGNLISSERQIALPGVQTCIECAGLIERVRNRFSK